MGRPGNARATRSDDTVLDGAFVLTNPSLGSSRWDFAGADLFVLSIFAWALVGFGNVYYGLARRVLELTGWIWSSPAARSR